MAARHWSCWHCYTDGCWTSACRAKYWPARSWTRCIYRKGVGMESWIRWRNSQTALSSWCFGRLAARQIYDGCRAVWCGGENLRPNAPRRTDLPWQAIGQLGPKTNDCYFRSWGWTDRTKKFNVASKIPDWRHWKQIYFHCYNSSRNHARRRCCCGKSCRWAL